jgi:hypothetical protein
MKLTKITLMRRAGLLKEGQRITFNGTKADQLYRIVKDNENALIFANGKEYGVDGEEMRNDLQNPVIIGYDEDGGEHDINVSDIEFIEL